MRLSSNFTLEELIATNTHIDNKPSNIQMSKLLYVATYLLQPIANKFGKIKIFSGYRSIEVNTFVKGASSSQHLEGEAVDFTLLDLVLSTSLEVKKQRMLEVFNWILLNSNIKFGQCILEMVGEKIWIHISLPRINKANQQALTYNGVEYKAY